jgi:hypothetical protein
MPVGNISVGRDLTLTILHPLAPSGGRVDLMFITGFDSKEQRAPIKVAGIDGITRTAFVPKDYTFTVMTERGSNTMDLFMSALDAAYRAGVNIPTGQLYTYTVESDNSTTTTLYDQVSFNRDDAGSWKQDAAVPQTLSGTAATKQVI